VRAEFLISLPNNVRDCFEKGLGDLFSQAHALIKTLFQKYIQIGICRYVLG